MKQLAAIGELGFKLLLQLFSHLIAAALNACADGCVDVFWARAKLIPHDAESFFHHALGRWAPAAVKGTHGLIFRVDQKNGKTISNQDAQRDPGNIRDQAIARSEEHT